MILKIIGLHLLLCFACISFPKCIPFIVPLSLLLFYLLLSPLRKLIRAAKSEDLIFHFTSTDKQMDKVLKAFKTLVQKQKQNYRLFHQEKEEKETILEGLGEGVLVVDKENRITYVNFIASKMIGIPKRHLVGKALNTKDGSPVIEKIQKMTLACQERETILTDSLSMGEARKLYLDLIAAPKIKARGAVVILQDKSNHYKVLEIGKDFVANASHELRTPITIVKGFAETLQDLPEISHEMLVDITEKIVRNCQRMENLVRNLLTLADIENLPKSRFRECDLFLLAENCKHQLLTLYPDAHVHVQSSGTVRTISADPDLIELALMNLLENAAKYSRPPAQITLSLEERDAEVQLTLKDKGIGIPPADLEHIFERFYTVDKTHSRRLGGAGLGLSIVKTIVEKHDGSIHVSSIAGEGTSFTLCLPFFSN